MMKEGILSFKYCYRAAIPSFDIRDWTLDILRFVFLLGFRNRELYPER